MYDRSLSCNKVCSKTNKQRNTLFKESLPCGETWHSTKFTFNDPARRRQTYCV